MGLNRVGLAYFLAGLMVVSTLTVRGTLPNARAANNCPETAAQTRGWGAPSRVEDFADPSSLAGWKLYDAPGHNGNGVRVPSAASVEDGFLKITGNARGETDGMALLPGQVFGRWEVCIASPPASANYHSVLLLWPDSNVWPTDGEVDFMEIVDPARQQVQFNLHYGPDNRYESGQINSDASKWHAWAVEWTQDHLVAYLDGIPWFESKDPTHLPPGPMHLCIQLDNFGGDISQGGQQLVEWAREYSL